MKVERSLKPGYRCRQRPDRCRSRGCVTVQPRPPVGAWLWSLKRSLTRCGTARRHGGGRGSSDAAWWPNTLSRWPFPVSWRVAGVCGTSHPGGGPGGRCRMSERGRDLYGLLGVAPDADAGEVARAYRRRLREVHPDTRDRLTGGPESAQAHPPAPQEAYSVLRDPARRAGYDVQRRAADVQRRAALTRADAPEPGVAVPV